MCDVSCASVSRIAIMLLSFESLNLLCHNIMPGENMKPSLKQGKFNNVQSVIFRHSRLFYDGLYLSIMF
jgi:hypothetical protein